MEQKNLYEIIKPVRELNHKSGRFKKGFIALIIVLIVTCGVGLIAYEKGLDINLPFEINKLNVNQNTIYTLNHSIPTTIINPNLIIPSFSAGEFKIGYN